MPKMWAVLTTGCDVCNFDAQMLPYYGDKRGAIIAADRWNEENVKYTACLEALPVRVKFLKAEKES